MKITIFGDSITNGYDAGTFMGSTILKRTTEAACRRLNLPIEVILHGVNGENSTDGLSRRVAVKESNADYNLIFFGANDAAAYDPTTPADFLFNLNACIDFFGADKTILLTPPYHNDSVGDPERHNDLVESFREMTFEAARRYQVSVIDVYQAMREAEDPDALLQFDGLHFSVKGYQLLGGLIARDMEALTHD